MTADAKVIEYLNEALRHALTATSRAWLHHKLLEDWGLGDLSAMSRAESVAGMSRAEHIMCRIAELGGHPNPRKLKRLRIGRSPQQALENDLAALLEDRILHMEALEHCAVAGDETTADLFAAFAAEEEKRIRRLEEERNRHGFAETDPLAKRRRPDILRSQ